MTCQWNKKTVGWWSLDSILKVRYQNHNPVTHVTVEEEDWFKIHSIKFKLVEDEIRVQYFAFRKDWTKSSADPGIYFTNEDVLEYGYGA